MYASELLLERVSFVKSKKVTIREVAELAGVSIATVSQILNGKAKNFDPKTVKKVLAAKDELGYTADVIARQLVGKQSRLIGIIVPEITNPFFNTLVKGVEEVLTEAGFLALFCNGGFDHAKEEKSFLNLADRGVDGFIIASPSISDDVLTTLLAKKNCPALILDQKKTVLNSDELRTDDFLGGKLVGKYLKECGHKDVSVIVPNQMTQNIAKRLEGFLTFYPKATLISADLSKTGGKKSVTELLATNSTAVFALNDELAFGIYRGLKEQHKKIPEDMSVVGYDDVDMCSYLTPALTTVAQPIYELGKRAATMLLARLNEPDRPLEKIVLPVRLVERESVTIK